MTLTKKQRENIQAFKTRPSIYKKPFIYSEEIFVVGHNWGSANKIKAKIDRLNSK